MIKKKSKKATLQRRYVTEEKSLATIAQMLSCCPRTIRRRCVEHGIEIRESRGGKGTDTVVRTVFIDERHIAGLAGLSAMTRVPQAIYIREAIDITWQSMRYRYKVRAKKKGDNKKGGDQNRYQPFITSVEVVEYILHLLFQEYDISHILKNSKTPKHYYEL